MDPALESASTHQPLIPEQVQGNTLLVKGINCQPIAFRILSEAQETSSPLQTHEIATMAMIEGRAQKVALSVQDLSSVLGLTIEEIKNAVEKRKGFDIERLQSKSERRQKRMQATHLSPETLFSIKETAKKIIALSPLSSTIKLVELPATTLREREVRLLVSGTPDTKPEILIQIGKLGSGSIGEVTKWVHLKTLDRAALKLPRDANQVANSEEVQKEAQLLIDISSGLEEQQIPSVGIQLPPHRVSDIQKMSPLKDSFVPTSQTVGFLGHVYKGDVLTHYDELSPEQKYKAASQLTMGLHLLHDNLDRPHGDIKLENVFLDNENFYLADFGDGKTVQEREQMCQDFVSSASASVTSEALVNKINGIFSFLHPQDIQLLIRFARSRNMPFFQRIKKTTDIYDLGIALLYLFNRGIASSLSQVHNRNPKLYASLDQISKQQAPFDRTILSSDQQNLILCMLDPDGQKRPTAEAVSRAFPIQSS